MKEHTVQGVALIRGDGTLRRVETPVDAARNEPSPPRRRVVLANLALVGAAVAALLSVFLTFGGGIHRGPRPSAFAVGTALGWACVALLATFIALGRGRSMLGRPRALLVGAALATPTVLFVWMLVWNLLPRRSVRGPAAPDSCV